MIQKKTSNSIFNVLEKMKLVFSPKYGLANTVSITEMGHTLVKRSDFGSLVIANVIPMYRTSVMNKTMDIWNGGGAALTRERSQVKAFGEFIERFCAFNLLGDHPVSLQYNTYGEQCRIGDCLNPHELIDVDNSSYMHQETEQYSDDSVISWVKGIEITHKKGVWVPAQKVFLGIPLENGELPYMQWISTGLACGSSYQSALLSGIFEVVERDSFMLTWLLRLPGKRIVVDSAKNLDLMKLYKHITNHMVGDDNLHIYDISRTEGIYTILTFIRNDNPNSFGLITSAASDTDPEKALLKSLEELCLTQACAYSMWYEKDEMIEYVKTMKKEDVISLHDHLLYYGTGERSCEFDFIDSTKKSINLSDMQRYSDSTDEDDTITYIEELFRKLGNTVYSVDVTRPEILECGLYVVKAVIPEYKDLDVVHINRSLANKRLLAIMNRTGCVVNNAPHPFP